MARARVNILIDFLFKKSLGTHELHTFDKVLGERFPAIAEEELGPRLEEMNIELIGIDFENASYQIGKAQCDPE